MIDIVTIIAANMLIILIVLILSALPLYFAVKLVGGETGLIKIIAISLLLSLASAAATHFIGIYAGILMLAFTLFIYKLAFKISLLKAFIAWLMQYVFVVVAIITAVYFLAVL